MLHQGEGGGRGEGDMTGYDMTGTIDIHVVVVNYVPICFWEWVWTVCSMYNHFLLQQQH